MEKEKGKQVSTAAISEFATRFAKWADGNTASVALVREPLGMRLELISEHNNDMHLATAGGLAGGGSAVGGWADAEGFSVIETEDDYVALEAKPADLPKVAGALALFLAPTGSWTVVDVSIRRK